MTRIEQILRAYETGHLSAATAEFELSLAITPENVAAAMPMLPPEIVEAFREWSLKEVSEDEILVIGTGQTGDELKATKQRLVATSQAIRGWFSRQNELHSRLPLEGATSPSAQLH